MAKKVSEKKMRETYVKAYGKEFDDSKRKQHPLPIKVAYETAKQKLAKQKYIKTKGKAPKKYKSFFDKLGIKF